METYIEEVHKPRKKQHDRRSVISYYPKQIFSMDLVDLTKYSKFNDEYKWMLNCIDVYSRYAMSVPLKSKNAKDVVKGMNDIFLKMGTPKLLWTDEGKEFYNRLASSLLKKLKIKLYSTKSELKAVIVERFNRTILSLLFKEMSKQKTREWTSLFKPLVEEYNTSSHSGIENLRPIDVFTGEERYEIDAPFNREKSKFKVGDMVRIPYQRGKFDKSYYPNWTWDVFKVVKVQDTEPYTYELMDGENNKLNRKYYSFEMLKTKQPFGVYLIDKVLKTRKKNGVKEALVQWVGYDDPTWILESDIEE